MTSMAPDQVPYIEESSLTKDGLRTVAIAYHTAGSSAPPHYHTDYIETFEVLQGSMTVYMSPDLNVENLVPTILGVGNQVSIPTGTLHYFTVNEDSKIKTSFQPGSIGWEKIVLILKGMNESGELDSLIAPEAENRPIWLSILGEFTNTIFIGEALERVELVRAKKAAKIAALKEQLVSRFATEAELSKAAGLRASQSS